MSSASSDSLTVLYVHAAAELYGSDVALLNLIRHLPPTIRPIVVLPEQGPLADQLRERGVAVKVFPLAVPRRYYFNARRFYRVLGLPAELLICWRKLKRLIRAEKVDLVHLNTSILIGAAWVVHRCGVPLIWHWREILPERGWWREALIRAAQRWASRIPCISNEVRRQFYDQSKATVVFDAVVPDDTAPCNPERLRQELRLGSDALCIGTVGRIQYRKGQDVLIRAASQILKRFPNAAILIVGDVYKKNYAPRKALERLTEQLGIRDRVFFTGFRRNSAEVMRLLDVFVMPVRLPDGFGIVEIEAMLQGKPVVATNIGGSLDVVVEGETGFLVPPDNPDLLAEKIILLLDNPSLRVEMGEKGRQRVLQLFTIEHQVKQVVEIYHAAIRESRGRLRNRGARASCP
ncbi:glycosyltransferase family 4 protein [Candidatus Sumerlaeota bacterium]|nr:glycosyltransferase family 4 protein [Candidatus Sumerlaeota bacterium]